MIALALIAGGLAAAGLISVRLWPIRPCPRCGGSGRSTGSNGRRWNLCGRCGGRGEVRRWGAGGET